MAEYRVYQIKNGHVAGPPGIVAARSDLEAIEQAKQMVDRDDVEVWECNSSDS
jgi:hypothetical protein